MEFVDRKGPLYGGAKGWKAVGLLSLSLILLVIRCRRVTRDRRKTHSKQLDMILKYSFAPPPAPWPRKPTTWNQKNVLYPYFFHRQIPMSKHHTDVAMTPINENSLLHE